jgi:nitric oxide reductase subunit B
MVGLAVIYMINMVFFKNLTADYYWWWWIIHLWVEGAWELIATAVMAFVLIRLTGVAREKMYRWVYVEAGLVLFTGILGTGHHYYWIGTPDYWLPVGAWFSALEPVPILLMTIDALLDMRHRSAEPFNKVAWYFVGGSALMHFFGAGVYGFAQTLPVINKWTHGTQITASHGHFAFFGAFGMLVLGAMYYMVPKLRGLKAIEHGRGMLGFWLMIGGMLAMIGAFTIAGVVQVYLWRIVGMDFMVVRTQYVSFWIFFVWLFGLALFLPGTIMYLAGFFGMKGMATGGAQQRR